MSTTKHHEEFDKLGRQAKEILEILKDNKPLFQGNIGKTGRNQQFSEIVLKSLSFASMDDRYHGIVDARNPFLTPS